MADARYGDSRYVHQDRHRRIGLDHIDIQTPTVKNPFADREQPAHVGVRGEEVSQDNGRYKQADDRKLRQQRRYTHRVPLSVHEAGPSLDIHGHGGVRRRYRQTLGDQR